MYKYEIILYWSAEDMSYIAEVTELPGCMADGSTQSDAIANAHTVIGDCIETARDHARDIPEPKGRLAYA